MITPPYDDRDGFMWYDGAIVPWRDAKVHVLNHGLHYGSAVFEGARIYNGNAFKLTEHSERLHRSAELIGFSLPYSVEALDEACKQVIVKQNITDGYLRPIAWRGSEHMAISAQHNSIHVAIAAWEWPPYYSEEIKKNGIKLTIADWRRPDPATAPSASKAAGLYMICTMSKHKAESAGFHDALMLDWRGYIAEGTGANFFMIIEGEIHTPTPDCFLDGITRRTVIALAEKRGYKVIERRIKPEDLAHASEAFFTGSAAEVTPIGSVDSYQFKVGEITQHLIADYQTLVRS